MFHEIKNQETNPIETPKCAISLNSKAVIETFTHLFLQTLNTPGKNGDSS